ncbi:zinc finger protein 236-like [Hydractinia symbiolongicarpus]|uniref:zinc finger protein 236-like n=1 Tax=Hydractinia symbiolongicarpus TaxID=13093 RepID=UPI00254A7A48|nr:zinc finger protein 236-like [Hydractinia symbiolongicarpus]
MAQSAVNNISEETNPTNPILSNDSGTCTEEEEEIMQETSKGDTVIERLHFNKSLVVEKIVDVSFSKEGDRFYRVQWEETWEREEDLLLACKDLLRDYWENHLISYVSQEKMKPSLDHNDTLSTVTSMEESKTEAMHDSSEVSPSEILTTKVSTEVSSPEVSPPEMSTLEGSPSAISEVSPSEESTSQIPFPDISPPNVAPVACSANSSQTSNAIEAERAKDFLKDIPEQYRNVGFAKSIREQFLAEVPIENKFDFIEDFIAKRNEPKKRNTIEKRPREDIIREYISYRNGTRVACEVCGESFADKKSLLRHKICRHAKYSPHQCGICRKMFVKPGDVRRHMATHSDIRAYYCCYCSKAYKTKNHLQRHIKAKHKEDSALVSASDGMEEIIPMTNDSSDSLSDNIINMTSGETSAEVLNIVQQQNGNNLLSPLHDEMSNPHDTVLHPVAINANTILLHDTSTVLQNANVILHNHPALSENFMTTRADGVQMCLIDRPFF